MNQSLKVLGIVGLRSGSKGVPDKNIRPLNGIPLVGWILGTAKKSKYINRLVVSTDSEKYAEVARSYGAETPFREPDELATDLMSDFEYVSYALKWLKDNEGYEPDIVVRMMATVPLQSTEDIDSVIEILMQDPAVDSAVVVSEARQHPHKALKIVEDALGGTKIVSYFTESGREVTPKARQRYEKAYFRSNVIAFRPRVVANTDSLTGDRVKYHIIPQERAIDIDNPLDFYLIEQLMRGQPGAP